MDEPVLLTRGIDHAPGTSSTIAGGIAAAGTVMRLIRWLKQKEHPQVPFFSHFKST
jgi:hypothetical protein